MHDGAHRPGFGIISSVKQAANTGMHHGTCAHGARFDGGEQIAFIQTVGAEDTTGLPEGNNFGVGRRVAIRDVAIKSGSDDLSFMNNDCSDRNLAEFERSLRGAQGFLHPEFVVVRGMSVVRKGHSFCRTLLYSGVSCRQLQ